MRKNKPFEIFTLQWHITNHCQLKCKHCYVDFSERRTMDYSDFQKAIRNYRNFLDRFGVAGRIYFTGGDPLLHPKFWDMVAVARAAGIDVSVFGNYHLLYDRNLVKMKEHGIKFYQLSLEGLEPIHDDIRGQGTFRGVIDAIGRLESHGIQTLVNMTVSRMNLDQVLPLIEYLAYHTELSRFDFVRLVPMGRATSDQMVTSLEYRVMLLKVLRLEEKIKADGRKLVIGKKDHLWKLLYHEADRLRIDMSDMANGCGMAYRHLTIVENGDIYLCRKLPVKIGNLVQDDLATIYENNDTVTEVLSNEYVVGCQTCELKNVCR